MCNKNFTVTVSDIDKDVKLSVMKKAIFDYKINPHVLTEYILNPSITLSNFNSMVEFLKREIKLKINI